MKKKEIISIILMMIFFNWFCIYLINTEGYIDPQFALYWMAFSTGAIITKLIWVISDELLSKDITSKANAIKTCVKINDITGINLLANQIIKNLNKK